MSLHSTMHRVLLRLNPVRPVTAIRQIQPLRPARIFRRNLSFLNQANGYLLKLLDDSGFSNLKTPLEGLPNHNEHTIAQPGSDVPSFFWSTPEQFLEAYWMIDRNNVSIHCALKLGNKEEDLNVAPKINITYPGYSENVTPPEIPALRGSGSPKAERARQFMNSMWRTFCVNDLLNLHVKAAMDSRGKMEVLGCDAVVDECAVHRQPEIFRHVERNDFPVEIEAEKHLLVYRKFLEMGRIGTIVNGAGLAMSTCDTIDLLHGKSSNFLDAGGKATPETIKEAFRIVLKDTRVNTIIVNVFGGVIQGDMIATGIISAMKDLEVSLPVVARIQGTNGSLGMKMLRDSGFRNLYPHENLYNAVEAAVKLSRPRRIPIRTISYERDARIRGASQPFPDVYTLIHTSPAFRTNNGRIRPAVETYALKGQGNRRVRLARPYRRGDPALDIPRISAGKAKTLLEQNRLVLYLKEREKLVAERMAMRNGIDARVQGPGAAFFNEKGLL